MVWPVDGNFCAEPDRRILAPTQAQGMAPDQVFSQRNARTAASRGRHLQNMAWNFANDQPACSGRPGLSSLPRRLARRGHAVSRRGETTQLTKPLCRQNYLII